MAFLYCIPYFNYLFHWNDISFMYFVKQKNQKNNKKKTKFKICIHRTNYVIMHNNYKLLSETIKRRVCI